MRLILCALALVALAGPDQAAAATKAAPNSTDGQIQATIRAKFSKSKISSDHFTVTVQNGVATLEGKTSVMQHKGVATRIARTSGASAVRNHIQISEEAKQKAVERLRKIDPGAPVARERMPPLPAAPKAAVSEKQQNVSRPQQSPPLARATVIPPPN